jgi:hypothetical protein
MVSSLVERSASSFVPNDAAASTGAISESCGQIPYNSAASLTPMNIEENG